MARFSKNHPVMARVRARLQSEMRAAGAKSRDGGRWLARARVIFAEEAKASGENVRAINWVLILPMIFQIIMEIFKQLQPPVA